MPLYVARWQNLSCALVQADSVEHVHMILDEQDDTEGLRVFEYTGPVVFDITLPTNRPTPIRQRAFESALPLSSDDIELGDVVAIANRESPRVMVPETDTGEEMLDAIYELAFPHLHATVAGFDLALMESEVPDAYLEKTRTALVREAELLVHHDWRRRGMAHSDDPAAWLANKVGASKEVARSYLKQVFEDEEGG